MQLQPPVWLTLVALAGAAASAPARPFAECDERRRADPGGRETAKCFFDAAKRQALWQPAGRRLEELRAQPPDSPWPSFYLGHVLYSRDPSQAEELYREALEIAGRSAGETAEAEIEAGLALTRRLAKNGSLEEADEVLARAAEVARRHGDPTLRAKVSIRQAYQAYYRGRQLDTAYHRLRPVCDDILEQGPESVARQCLDAMYLVSYVLGRFEESRSYQHRRLDLARQDGNLPAEAIAQLTLAVVHIEAELPSRRARKKAGELLRQALASAEQAGYPPIEGQALLLLGKLEGGAPGRRQLEACRDLAAKLGDRELANDCRATLAANILPEDPEKARQLVELVLAAAAESDDPWITIYGWQERLPVHWATLPRAEAVDRSLDVLDRIEALRELQVLGSGRAGLVSAWAEIYYWLSGRLLAEAETETPALAFEVTERMRSQVLLEALSAAGAASPPPADAAAVGQLATVLELKAEIQRRLLDPGLEPTARDAAIAERDAVESREAELRGAIAKGSPLSRPPLATLGEIEGLLADDQALLSFQLGLDEDMFRRFAGGSWLLVSTRAGTRTYRLAEGRAGLEPDLDLLLGLEELEAAPKGLAGLYRTLLRNALADLPSAVDRLVIIPDGKLHRLPFALLRSAAEAEPLIAHYQLTVAPSATLWWQWKKLGPRSSQAPALVLADPALAGQGLAGGLPPLPHAREEGRAVVANLGGGSRLLVGEEATERFLKDQDLRRFGVLHFAAHAVIDNEVPERSAVFLAPGAEGEDGWLQPQDIVDLDLDGRVVVLASCDSAGGKVLRGEGVMSLARAFFQAGSPVVVASLKPLPDDWTAAVFRKFYRRLAAGESVAGALAAAQREMIREGAPAVAWAGLVALGNGDLVPFPGGLEQPSRPWIAGLLLAAALLVAAGVAWFLLRRRSP